MLALFQDLGPPEIIIILLLALLLFGAKRLPEIGRGLGKGIREFKGGVKGLADDVKVGMEDDAKSAPAPRAEAPSRAETPAGSESPTRKDAAD